MCCICAEDRFFFIVVYISWLLPVALMKARTARHWCSSSLRMVLRVDVAGHVRCRATAGVGHSRRRCLTVMSAPQAHGLAGCLAMRCPCVRRVWPRRSRASTHSSRRLGRIEVDHGPTVIFEWASFGLCPCASTVARHWISHAFLMAVMMGRRRSAAIMSGSVAETILAAVRAAASAVTLPCTSEWPGTHRNLT